MEKVRNGQVCMPGFWKWICIVAVACLTCIGIAGCSSADNGNADDRSGESSSAEQAQEAVEEDSAQALVGVWGTGDDCLAFDGEKFFGKKNYGYFTYEVVNDGETIKWTDAQGADDFSISDDGNTLNLTSGYYEGRYAKSDDDPAAYISENVVELGPNDSWENEAISISMFGARLVEGQVIYHDGSTHTMQPGDCELLFETDAVNKTAAKVEANAVMYLNNMAVVSPSISGLYVNPFSQENIDYHYEVAPTSKDSIKSCRILFVYTDSETGEAVTPAIVVQLF